MHPGLDVTRAESGCFAARGVGPGRLRQDADPALTAGEALQQVRERWGAKGYDVGKADGMCCAMHLAGGDLITADTPEGLDSAIRAHFVRGPAAGGAS
jgi:hypothetical protein